MKGWTKFHLEQLSEFITKGSTPTTFGFKWVDKGIPFLRSECVTDEGFNMKGLSFISQEAHNYMVRSKVIDGDILISITGNVGRLALFPKELREGNINQHIARVRINSFDTCSKLFVYYQLTQESYRQYYNGIVTGAAYPQLSLKQIRETPVFLPPYPIQVKISSILSAYDELIENNIKRIKLLEELAQHTYEEWFIKFRIKGNQLKIAKDTGLPKGWRLEVFSKVVSVNPRTIVKTKGLSPFIPMGSISEISMVIDPIYERVPSGGAKFKNGDTLFARITPCLENGKTGFVQFMKTPDQIASGSTEFIVLRKTETCNEYFIYLTARTDHFRGFAINSMVGSDGRQRVQPNFTDKYKIAIANIEIMNEFRDFCKPLFNQIQKLAEQNKLLREARDILLPRLMTGVIGVEAVQESLAMAAEPTAKYRKVT